MSGVVQSIRKQPANNGSSPRPFSRPWLPEDDDKLLDWAGYEPSHEDCPASWPFRPCRALQAWSARHECKGQGWVVAARFAETPACEPCETPTPHRECEFATRASRRLRW